MGGRKSSVRRDDGDRPPFFLGRGENAVSVSSKDIGEKPKKGKRDRWIPLGEIYDSLMSEYGLTLDEAISIPDRAAADLLKHASRRKFLEAENLATLIQLKMSELLSGKKAKYNRPVDDNVQPITTPMTSEALGGLQSLSKL